MGEEVGRPTAFLRTEELPERLRPAYVIESQKTVPDYRGCKRALVLRRCLGCDHQDWLLASNVRRGLKMGRNSGLCASCNASCRNVFGEGHPAWKGGRFIDDTGYVRVWTRGRAGKGGGGYYAEHRLVMGKVLGRPLRKGETVHHKNRNRQDNRPENLELWVGGHPSGMRLADHHCPGCQCFAEKGE